MSGHVFSVLDGDTVPLRDHWVIMHEVTDAGGQAVDSARTDALGAYFLRSREWDTTAVYLSSVSYRDIAYFSNPVTAPVFNSDTAQPLLVYDTSSVGPPVRVVERHVVVRAPEADGSRSALEILVLENPGNRTRITSDTAFPVWQGAIPEQAVNLEFAPSDVSPGALYRRDNRVALAAAVPPGPANRKRVVFGYFLPKGVRDLVVPVDQPLGRLQVLIEDPGVELLGGSLRAEGLEIMQDLQLMRFAADDVSSGMDASFRFSDRSSPLSVLLWTILVMSALAMAAVLTVWLRRPHAAAPAGDASTLAAQIAALDERFAARAAQASDAERAAYDNERATLKAKLTDALARSDSGS